MKIRRITSLFLCLIILLIPNITLAATFDLYHIEELSKDVKFVKFARKPSEFKKVYYDIENYLQKQRDGKYYSFKEIDTEMKAGALNSQVAIKNLQPYILVDELVLNKIQESIKLNTPQLNKTDYELKAWKNYENALTDLNTIKDKRFVKEIDLNNKIEVLANAYKLLIPIPATTEDLEALIASAKKRNKDNYSLNSVKNLEEKIDEARKILELKDPPREEIFVAKRNLEIALSKLELIKKVSYIEKLNNIIVVQNSIVQLPEKVKVVFEDGSSDEFLINWPNIDTSILGRQKIEGKLEGLADSVLVEVDVIMGLDKSTLEETISEAEVILGSDKTEAQFNKVSISVLEEAVKEGKNILENSESKAEIDLAEKNIRRAIDNLVELAGIRNIQPVENVYIQPGQKIEISFDSKSGGTANFSLDIPTLRAFSLMSSVPRSNMEEQPLGSGHYVGFWTAPKSMYGSKFTFSVNVEFPDGEYLYGIGLGTINITNEYTVNFKIGNEIISSYSAKAGGKLANIPSPQKVGYKFSHWEVNGEKIDPENFVINESVDIVAVLNPISGISYSVSYVDSSGTSIAESEIVEGQVFGDEVSVEAKLIEGYQAVEEAKTFKINSTENKIVFVYNKRTDIPYIIKYTSKGEEISNSDTAYATFKEDNIVKAKEIPGYIKPIEPSIYIENVDSNEVVLEYSPRTDIPYRVRHIEKLEDGQEKIIETIYETGTFKDTIAINANKYPGLVADTPSQELTLNSIDNNNLDIFYKKIDGLYYQIKYTNSQGEVWSSNQNAKFGEIIKREDVFKLPITNNGKDYLIKDMEKDIEQDSIIIDDRLDRNFFNVKVIEYFPLEKHTNLSNLLAKGKKLLEEKPPYANLNQEWNNYLLKLQNATNNFENQKITEENYNEIVDELVDSIEIIEAIKEFDKSWDDRVTPKGFAKTINDQAETADVYGRLKIRYDYHNSRIYFGMSKEQQGKQFVEGAVGVGVKTAMLNVLKTEKLEEVESKGVVAKLTKEDGSRLNEDELIKEGIKLAGKWLPEGMTISNYWGDLIGMEAVNFIMRGKTSNGTDFFRTYYFYFVDKENI